jgi:Ca2+-binding EF-hand superfamily protein
LSDLEAIMMSLKRDPKEAKEMLNDIDPNNDGTLTFDEFLHLMTSLEKQLVGGMDANGRLPQLPNEM